ncbi:MAG: radical SAM family heme chaperone HemW [Candidatus Omnitrophica bacterium]|nr:radical SAM family heme chaperone HemW [Candidatus Omnitrophota bacterium]
MSFSYRKEVVMHEIQKYYLDVIIITSKFITKTVIMKRGLYVHIPFCVQRCRYCDFYSEIYSPGHAKEYINVLCKEVGRLECDYQSIYIGGGTPSVLDVRSLERLLSALERKRWPIDEFTVEVNPESLNEDKLKLFKDYGVDRISIGVQSFIDKKLKKLGRLHSAEKAKNKVREVFSRGFKNISGDLIFGLEGETLKEWRKDLKEALILPFSHLSTYMLTYEKGTLLHKELRRGSIKPLSEDKVASMYREVSAILKGAGMLHYEISNFCLPGFPCVHNVNYWNNGLYTGLGPSAVSYDGQTRLRNIDGSQRYIAKFFEGELPVSSIERLTKRKKARETAALKVRMAEGIDFEWFKDSTGFDFISLEGRAVDEMAGLKLVKYIKKDGRLRGVKLTARGFFYSDTVSAAFL